MLTMRLIVIFVAIRVNIYHHPDSGTADASRLPVVYRFSP